MKPKRSVTKLIDDLKERAKELNCLYEVQEILNSPDKNIQEMMECIIKVIPPGWQYPDICQVQILFRDQVFRSEDFKKSKWVLEAEITVQEEQLGSIRIYYTEKRPNAAEGPFLKEERKLINTISDQVGSYILHQHLKSVFTKSEKRKPEQKSEWWVILEMLRKTDPKLLIRISKKMVNYLCWSGIKEAEHLFERFGPAFLSKDGIPQDENRPYQSQAGSDYISISDEIFAVAGSFLSEQEILNSIHKWIKQDQSGFLVNILEDSGSSLVEISGALERYHHLSPQGLELSNSREKNFRVALIRRLLSDQPDFIDIAKRFIEIDEFNNLIQRIIYPTESHGKLGGKGSGLYISDLILKKSAPNNELIQNIKIPKTWYLTSDGVLKFMKYNNLEDIIEQKYKDIDQVRKEYPYVIHVFKNSSFPPEIVKGLSQTLDDFGEVPLIIRSSSLLEDRLSTVFAGKYKSLFIANQGTKEERLEELLDAIAEVYASTFGPDPIEYRSERGLLDYHEEMGILIQQVVGNKIGDYFLPAFAGVAFSQNDYRWSSRIKQEDGLIRIVPGLGTRAVDRLSDDYPILISPGQPNLQVNVTLEETVRYSPKQIDAINLVTRRFETVSIQGLLKKFGKEYKGINNIVSVLTENHIQQSAKFAMDFDNSNFVVTFDGLIKNQDFIKKTHAILQILQQEYGYPVDIEFAHDGTDFYLLQCRSQSYREASTPATLPQNYPEERVIFSANKYISNGIVDNISHIVYVDPQKYSELADFDDLKSVGKAIGRINTILPKRQFILLGPGRWGSRGDIKLGVSVTYSEINNTAMLIEVARKQKDYAPDLSFGTHFFQDLVESDIRYLPLYPDERGTVFNEDFFLNSNNILTELFPDLAPLSEVIKIIDIVTSTGGDILQVLMNAEEEKAMAIITKPTDSGEQKPKKRETKSTLRDADYHWKWRLRAAENIAANLDKERFGVKGFYIFGSTKNGTAGPASDIDLLVHINATNNQLNELKSWFEGWSLSLSNMNFLRTGYKTDGLLDLHYVTDEDIQKRTSYAIKIGAVTDAARPLPTGSELKK